MVLGNRLMLGSVSSDKKHFEMGLKSMMEIQSKYGGDVLNRMINQILPQQSSYEHSHQIKKK
jgi:hypothetical protein